VRRLAVKFGHHADRFHDQQAQELDITTIEMDERHGYAETKAQQQWDAVAIDPTSKFLVQIEVGPRDATLIERLMRSSAKRLKDPQDLVLMTDGEASSQQCQTPERPTRLGLDDRRRSQLPHLVS